jgi:hypothetical protein
MKIKNQPFTGLNEIGARQSDLQTFQSIASEAELSSFYPCIQPG